MKPRKNFSGIYLAIIIVMLLFGVLLGVKLENQLAKSIRIAAYPPPNSPIPAKITASSEKILFPTPNPSPSPVILSNGWYLYEDREAGFSFSYPPNSRISVSQDLENIYKTVNIALMKVGASGGYQGIVIEVIDNPNGLPPEEVVNKIYGNSPNKPSNEAIKNSFTAIKVGKVTGLKTVIPPTNTELTILVTFKDRILILAPVHGPAVSTVDPKVLDIFYKVLDTVIVSP